MGDEELASAVDDLIAMIGVSGRRVVVIVPDATRTAPLRRIAALIDAAIGGRARHLRWVVALGTHQPMSSDALADHLGPVSGEVVNHEWWIRDALVSVGVIGAEEVSAITGGRRQTAIDVRLNRAVAEADVALVCGPVFPHEVVGFSGGNKYFFPGVAGQEIIDATHWLGALITSSTLIGTLGANPVRALIDRAAALIPAERWCAAMVVAPGTGASGAPALVACCTGRPEPAWAQAAALSARTHVRLLAKPVRTALSVMPRRYEDLWTAAKGMYKVEPVVADGGEAIIYAPHVATISVTHGADLARVGYHVRDYFVGQWDRFSSVPGSVLAHSTHVAGLGTWSAEEGERPRIRVTLATAVDAATCAAHGLGYRDPASIDVAEWTARAERDPDLLVVPDAGEMLYRLAPPAA
jgi:nickel-dependent lactate racemase